VTFTHFTRVLNFLDIILASEEIYLLIKKFSKDNYCINYVAFIQAIQEVQDFFDKNKELHKEEVRYIFWRI
jgi:Ca2+-binding EF-hand superfamily protein